MNVSRAIPSMTSSGRWISKRHSPRLTRKYSLVALLLSSPQTWGFHQIHWIPRNRISRGFHLSRQSVAVHRCMSTHPRIVEGLQHAYQESETDGVLRFASSLHASTLQVADIVAASLEVSQGRSGDTASILSAWIGSCCLMHDQKSATNLANDLIHAFEDLEKHRNIAPDLVAYSLAYSVFCRDAGASAMAEYVLNQAIRKSKKLAGGKRRKTLAASRRKTKVASINSEIENNLKRLCGNDFSILHETDELLVINKPSGIPCFHRKKTTAGKIRKGQGEDSSVADISLEDALISCNVPLSTVNPDALGLVHRLDRGSSGCLVLAKTDSMHALLVAEFFLRRTEKKYKTIVAPAPDLSIPNEGIIDTPVDGRSAKSFYRIIERYGESAALLEFEIYTGRKHQIRVHASQELSAPVYMDDVYGSHYFGSNTVQSATTKQCFFLHSAALRIPECDINVEAPLPTWWDATIQSFREQA